MKSGNVPEGSSAKALLAEAAAAGVPKLDAELLLARTAGLSRGGLLAREELVFDAGDSERLRARLRRRAAGEPLAYIEGEREFWSLNLIVTPDVLVPRPETELLVEAALDRLDARPREVADFGTGSGAIALALAHERPRWKIVATDASPAALAIARANAARLGLYNVEFLQGDWAAALRGRRVDAVISNPPYIAPDDPALQALRYEPLSALAAPDLGFADLLAIVRQAPDVLRPGGWLLLEHGSTQAARIAAALAARGFARVATLRDLAAHERVTLGQWPAQGAPG